MNQGGFKIRNIRVVIFLGAMCLAGDLFGQAAPAGPTPDQIQRLLEAERQQREQELNDPGQQAVVEIAQQVDAAINRIKLRSQPALISAQQFLQRGRTAPRHEQAIENYQLAIVLESQFKKMVATELGDLLPADHPAYMKAAGALDAALAEARAEYVKITQLQVEANWQREEYRNAMGLIEDAMKWMPGAVTLGDLRRESEKREAAFDNRQPSPDASSRGPELVARQREINRLLRDGRYLYELRDFDEAKRSFDEVMRLDGRNDIASNYLRMINKFKNIAAKDMRTRVFAEMVQEVNEAWKPPSHQRTLPVPNPEWIRQTGGSATGNPGANNVIMNKLQSIRVPNVPPMAGFALNEAVNTLTQMAKENDHIALKENEKGMNIWIKTDLPLNAQGGTDFTSMLAPAIHPATGMPIRNRMASTGSMADGPTDGATGASGMQPQVGLPTIPITRGGRLDPARITIEGMAAPLTNVSLSQLLTIITQSCDQPIDWRVKDGTVVLSYRPADADHVTKVFHIKPNAFWNELVKVDRRGHQVTPIPSSPLSEGFDTAIRSKNIQRRPDTTDNRYYDPKTGFQVNGGSFAGSGSGGGSGSVSGSGGGIVPGVNQAASQAVQAYLQQFGITANVVFNPSNGQLLVRAQLANLEQIEQIIEILNTSPEQLVIEAKFAEIEFNDGESLGFDWYLGNFHMKDGKYITGAGPHPTFIGKPTAANPSGYFPYPGTLQGNTFVPSQFSIPPSPNEGRLTSSFKGYGNPLWTFTGLMTDPQFRVVLNAIDTQEGAELLSAPRILAISGRQADISVQDQRNIVTGVVPTFTPGAGGGGFGGGGGAGGGTVQPIVNQQQMGPSLTVLPYVNADGYTIEMSLAPSITEFLGYEESTFEASVFAAGGNVVRQQVPMPRIRTRNLNVQCVVWDQTVLALGGLIAETVQTTKDKVPFLGNLPFVGRAFRGEGRNSKKKNMVIYVKPTIIDPAGNPKNRPNQLPFSRTPAPDRIDFIPTPPLPMPGGGGAGAPGGNPGGGGGGINNKILNRAYYRR